MTQPQLAAINLTGIWQGFFSYPNEDPTVPFGATLIDTSSGFTGATNEICTRGPDRGAVLFGIIEGRRQGRDIHFIKSYEGKAHCRIQYRGLSNSDGSIIEGIWTIRPDWSGKFVMVRSRRMPARQQVPFARAG
ncbi:hypothetical protein FHS83_003321 [Rhizomicrobium palustre]|uniref:DUF1579 domain-containing protein n=1 Tax=Rhizomicrobium palustre TaxID=189966 RepID=A0A846N312_9PROT|nr:hypothetical protein [Rhizomicrobium palustre]NIK90003.1 hypothetical protein [Rhizomicrobium palustre]